MSASKKQNQRRKLNKRDAHGRVGISPRGVSSNIWSVAFLLARQVLLAKVETTMLS